MVAPKTYGKKTFSHRQRLCRVKNAALQSEWEALVDEKSQLPPVSVFVEESIDTCKPGIVPDVESNERYNLASVLDEESKDSCNPVIALIEKSEENEKKLDTAFSLLSIDGKALNSQNQIASGEEPMSSQKSETRKSIVSSLVNLHDDRSKKNTSTLHSNDSICDDSKENKPPQETTKPQETFHSKDSKTLPSGPVPNKLLPKLLQLLHQDKIIEFDHVLSEGLGVKKIGEATFSEVFKMEKFKSHENVVLKVIPFGSCTPSQQCRVLSNHENPPASSCSNLNDQPSIIDVFQEIYTTHKLNALSKPPMNFHFVKFISAHIVKGPYSPALLNEWDIYDSHHQSENTRPDKFGPDQLFAMILLSHGGTDLEHCGRLEWDKVKSILAQVVMSLAAAERVYQFEHRDLHWGNILLQFHSFSSDLSENSSIKNGTDPIKNPTVENNSENTMNTTEKKRQNIETTTEHMSSTFTYSMHSKLKATLPSHGVKVTLIDFTLSRMSSDKSSQVHHVPLNDEAYFTGEGDYQFDIYRLMRRETNGEWMRYCPKTNVYWLHYLTDKLLTSHVRPVARSKKEKADMAALKDFYNRLLTYESAMKVLSDLYIRSQIEFKSV